MSESRAESVRDKVRLRKGPCKVRNCGCGRFEAYEHADGFHICMCRHTQDIHTEKVG